MSNSYDIAEYVIRQVARGAIAAGRALECQVWLSEQFPKHWQTVCERIFMEELNGFIQKQRKEARQSGEEIGMI